MCLIAFANLSSWNTNIYILTYKHIKKHKKENSLSKDK